MPEPPVALTIGGQCYRVHSDADPTTLQRLAQLVDDRVATCNPSGRLSATQALVYAALLMADELEHARAAHASLQSRTRANLEDVLHRIDAAVTATDALLNDAPAQHMRALNSDPAVSTS